MAPIHPTLLHPLTGQPIVPVYIDRHGRGRYPFIGAAEDGDGTAGKDSGADGGTDGAKADDDSGDGGDDLGYPKDTPVAEMTVDQKAAYFQHKASKEEARRKGLSKAVGGKTADQIQADMAELEQLRKGRRTDSENAVAEAEERVRKQERLRAGERIVKATVESALSHLEKKSRVNFIDGLNLARYVDEDGEVDTDKLRAYLAQLSQVAMTETKTKRNFGAGHREEGAPVMGAQGLKEAQRRYGIPAGQN